MRCFSDTLTWFYAFREGSDAPPATRHFGRLRVAGGPARIVAVGDPGEWREWLADAAAAGAWVSVVATDSRVDADDAQTQGLSVRRVRDATPLGVVRALDAESQVAPVDRYVALDRPSRLLMRMLPFARGFSDPRRCSPSAVVQSALQARMQ